MANMLYNGVELPDINTVWTDKETYPYALIMQDTLSCGVYLSSHPITFKVSSNGDTGLFYSVTGCSYAHYNNYPDLNIWSLQHEKTITRTDGFLASGSGYYPIWSSYDVLGSDGSVYLAASDPVPVGGSSHVTESSGDGYALYNGVKLPNIDSVWTDELKQTHPYAYIGSRHSDGSTILIVSKNERSSYQDGRVSAGTVDVTIGLFVVFALNDGLWSKMPAELYQVYVYWSSSDLYYLSTIETIGGTLYLAASDPIPLDGMTVIEWDGVTDGLEQPTDTTYRVLDSYVAISDTPILCLVAEQGVMTNPGTFTSCGETGWDYCIESSQIALSLSSATGNEGTCFINNGTNYVSLLAYPASTEPEEPEDTTKKDFWNGVACGLCGSGTPNFSDTSPFGVGYITGCKLRALRGPKTPPTLTAGNGWYKGTLDKSSVTKINFVDSYTPTGSETESWVADDGESGEIMCYLNDTEVTIAGNGSGKIYANADSSWMLAEFGATEINGLDILDTSNVTDMSIMFAKCEATSLDLSSFDTSNVTKMYRMFAWCTTPSLDLSRFDTSNVMDMTGMFLYCTTPSLDLSRFDTSSVTNMSEMFYNCEATSLDLSSFDTSNVTGMSSMFSNCEATSLDLSSFDTSSVTGMSGMFYKCKATSLDLSSFDTSNVTNMRKMFYECELTSLDLSSFDTSNVTDMREMFYNASSLTVIYVGDSWDMSNAKTSDMFTGCGVSSVTPKT